MRSIFCLSLLLLSACVAEQVNFTASQVYVVDGDTLKIEDETYRLKGFDTPETYRAKCSNEKALGNKATARLRELIVLEGMITLQVDQGRDKYGRKLAKLFVGAKDVGAVLIQESLARPYFGGKRGSWCE